MHGHPSDYPGVAFHARGPPAPQPPRERPTPEPGTPPRPRPRPRRPGARSLPGVRSFRAVRVLPGIQMSRRPGIQTSRRPGVQASRRPGVQASRRPGIQTSGRPGAYRSFRASALPHPGPAARPSPPRPPDRLVPAHALTAPLTRFTPSGVTTITCAPRIPLPQMRLESERTGRGRRRAGWRETATETSVHPRSFKHELGLMPVSPPLWRLVSWLTRPGRSSSTPPSPILTDPPHPSSKLTLCTHKGSSTP
jgi:hypothetical protein